MFQNQKQTKTRYDEKPKRQIDEERDDNFISKKKHEIFDYVDPKQVNNNARYGLGGLSRAILMFFLGLGIVILVMYLIDFFRGAL